MRPMKYVGGPVDGRVEEMQCLQDGHTVIVRSIRPPSPDLEPPLLYDHHAYRVDGMKLVYVGLE